MNNNIFKVKRNNSDIDIPIIDIQNINNNNYKKEISNDILNACRKYGFYYIINHGIDQELIDKFDELHRKFLLLPLEVKLKWKKAVNKHDSMGYIKLSEQNTNGYLHYKEGIYLHVQNEENRDCSNETSIFPTKEQEIQYDIVGFKETVENYIRSVKILGLKLMGLVSISLNLPEDYIETNYMKNPSATLGLFKYPSFDLEPDNESENKWGISNHTDYVFLTILKQDNVGGLQIKSNNQYIDAPTIPNTLICNPGDLLQILTGNNYLSVYHRVLLNKSGNDRFSAPLFLAPDWYTPITPLQNIPEPPNNIIENNLDKYKGYSFEKFYKERINRSFSNKTNS